MDDNNFILDHDKNIINRYGGKEFDMRMDIFPDGYHNLGYWKYCHKDREMASKSLLRKAVDVLQINRDDIVLDAACGVGQGTIDTAKRYNCKKIVGLDITPENIRFASLHNKEKNVFFVEDNTCSMKFSDEEFTKIYSVDSAIHFFTRNNFFKEAYRVMKPGGVLVVMDTIVNPRIMNQPYKLLSNNLLDGWCVPIENISTIVDCKEQLSHAGFVDIEAFSICNDTLKPACHYFLSYKHWQDAVKIEGIKETLRTKLLFLAMLMAASIKLIDYGMFICRKPI